MEAKKGALVNSYIEVWRWTAQFESKMGVDHKIYKEKENEKNLRLFWFRNQNHGRKESGCD